MAPKKDKGAKKDAGGGDNALLVAAKAYEMQNEALQRQLAERMHRAMAADSIARDAATKMTQMQEQLAAKERDMFDITTEMNRQYKLMQENMMSKVTMLENEIGRLKDEILAGKAHMADTVREKDLIIARKDIEIEKLKAKMDEMTEEFGDMLSSTLQAMGERVEVSAPSWQEGAAGVAASVGGSGAGAGTTARPQVMTRSDAFVASAR